MTPTTLTKVPAREAKLAHVCFGSKADIAKSGGHVCFGPRSDVPGSSPHVRFTAESGRSGKVGAVEDFQELKEEKIIEVARAAKIIANDVRKVLESGLAAGVQTLRPR
jgi:hypothetical protein